MSFFKKSSKDIDDEDIVIEEEDDEYNDEYNEEYEDDDEYDEEEDTEEEIKKASEKKDKKKPELTEEEKKIRKKNNTILGIVAVFIIIIFCYFKFQTYLPNVLRLPMYRVPVIEDVTEIPIYGPYDVIEVIDGDTIKVKIDEEDLTIRLLGINAPESVNPDNNKNTDEGFMASQWLKNILTGKQVYLEYDEKRLDIYNRTLAYVYLADKETLLNAYILQEGYAQVCEFKPNERYLDYFKVVEEKAKNSKKGLWANITEFNAAVSVSMDENIVNMDSDEGTEISLDIPIPDTTPSEEPSATPTIEPTEEPTPSPTPTIEPSEEPSPIPEADEPTPSPTPTKKPTASPTPKPTPKPSAIPKESPTPTKKPTASPKESASPKPGTKPTSKPTPKPTPKPHTHSYTDSITSQPTCVNNGVKTYKCSCGDTYTESISAIGHNWIDETWDEIIHHPETGHIETTTIDNRSTSYVCNDCGYASSSQGAMLTHLSSSGHSSASESTTGSVETIETYVVDSPAWDETVTHTKRKCSVCGAE